MEERGEFGNWQTFRLRVFIEQLVGEKYTVRTGYIICGVQYKMKI